MSRFQQISFELSNNKNEFIKSIDGDSNCHLNSFTFSMQNGISVMYVEVVAGYNHSYAITDHSVYHWGESLISKSTNQAEESHSERKKESQTTDITTLPISIDNLSTGKNHAFGWNDSEVYCWGSNKNYQLGLEDEKQYEVTRASLLQKAIQNSYQLSSISCGEHHTLALFHVQNVEIEEQDNLNEQIIEKTQDYEDDSKIQLYAWGESDSYQLTLNTSHIVPYPVLTPLKFRHLENIYSHGDFNMALCNGKVYSWGCNLFSRLGLPVPSSQLPKVRVPRLVSLPEKIVKIALGTYHVVVVSAEGSAYAWGKGNMGQLGIDKLQTESKPVKIPCHQPITDASCGQCHTLVLLSDGRIKSCGSNVNGALGHQVYEQKDKKKRAKVLQLVDWDKQHEIQCITSGKHHNLVLTKTGKVYGWGSNSHGQVLPSKIGSVESEVKQKEKWDYQKQDSLGPSLEININLHTSKENKILSSPAPPLQFSPFLELQNWKRRYSDFLLQKSKQQKQMFLQFDQIMSKIKQSNLS